MIKNIKSPAYIIGLYLAVVSMAACETTTASSVPLKLNEILAVSDTESDWLEIYNTSGDEISLAGIQLRDSNNYWTFGSGTIKALAWLKVICDGSGKAGKTNFKLTSKGEQVSLYDADGALMDQVTYPSLKKDTSWGRVPDGTGAWTAQGSPSPGKANISGAPGDAGPAPDKGSTPDSGGKTKDSGGKTKDSGGKTKDSGGKTKDSGGKTKDSGGKTKDTSVPDLAKVD